MDTYQFTDIFLPRLVLEYVRGTMPLHALVDLDLWKKVFPYKGNKRNPQLNLNLVEIYCQALPDRTLLFIFLLPQPKKPEEAKFAVIRLKPLGTSVTCPYRSVQTRWNSSSSRRQAVAMTCATSFVMCNKSTSTTIATTSHCWMTSAICLAISSDSKNDSCK